jgi:sarcosine oxidase subunit gamma
MDDIANQESPLAQFWKRIRPSESNSSSSVELRELGFVGYVNLRGDPADPIFLESTHSVLSVGLPLTPNTTALAGDLVVLWLGPDEWLIVTPWGEAHRILNSLRQALATQVSAVNDLTSGYTTLILSGPRVEDTLLKGCGVDLNLRKFVVGSCSQTHIAKAHVAMWRSSDAVFHLIVRRSFAEYLALWIADAAEEFGLTAIRVANITLTVQEVAVAVET